MTVKIWLDVDFRSLDGVEDHFGDALPFDVDQVRLEQCLGGLEPLPADFDDPAVG